MRVAHDRCNKALRQNSPNSWLLSYLTAKQGPRAGQNKGPLVSLSLDHPIPSISPPPRINDSGKKGYRPIVIAVVFEAVWLLLC